MAARISRLAEISPEAQIADDVEIGPFCVIGPHVTIGTGCRLDSHVVIVGKTFIGKRNRFFPHTVIGAEPQDHSYDGTPTSVVIGDDNVFREGVTVNRGSTKEAGCTHIGNHNLLMANCHVAHDCWLYDRVTLVNGVLLGGHVHCESGAVVSGNSVVHHFCTLGRLSFVSGGCRVPQDVPPFMLAAGSDRPKVVGVNVVGLQRQGMEKQTIEELKFAFKLLFRKHKKVTAAREILLDRGDGKLSTELEQLLTFLERQQLGRAGRAREAVRQKRGTLTVVRPELKLNRRAA